jgi:glycosyltransferase involved in cell wall biosynthesis
MKIGICVRAMHTDGNSSTAFVLAETLLDAGHDVTLLSPLPGQAAVDAPGRRWAFIHIGQQRWESDAALIQRLGRTFAEQQFDVLVVLTGLPIPRIEEAYRLLPDSTTLVPAILGDREHVYEPAVRTARLWNVALTISPGLQREVEQRVPGRPVRMLTLAIDLPDPAHVASRASLGSPMRLISVGRLFGRKNVLVMPPILAECGRLGLDVSLTIVGEGPDRGPFEAAAQELSVIDRITFRSIPTQAELYQAFREHHGLLWTAGQGEGLGLVLLEAQANGCVPVATKLPGISDYAVEEGVTGLLAPEGDAAAFANQLMALSDPGRWRSLSAAGIERTRRLFSRDVMAGELATLLEQICAGGFPTPAARRTAPRHWLGWRAHVPPALRRSIKRLPF